MTDTNAEPTLGRVPSVNLQPLAGAKLPEIRTLLRPATRVRSDEGREFGVSEALQIANASTELEVYVGWDSQPIGVASRRSSVGVLTWEAAGPMLRERVLTAVRPLHAAGWLLDGTFSAAARWDMSRGTGGDLYEGCWVRMRR